MMIDYNNLRTTRNLEIWKTKNKKQRLKFPTTHARIYVKKYYKRKTVRKRDRKRKMNKVDEMSLFEYYENEIMFFNKKTDELLIETIMVEIQIAKRRKKRLRVSKKDKKQLKIMIITTLKAIAIVETYRLFQKLEIVPTDENIQMFYVRREQCFNELVILFLSKIKRQQQSNNR